MVHQHPLSFSHCLFHNPTPFHFYQNALSNSALHLLPSPDPAPIPPISAQSGPYYFSLRLSKTSLCSLPTPLLCLCGFNQTETKATVRNQQTSFCYSLLTAVSPES